MNPHSTLVWRRVPDGRFEVVGSARFSARRVRISVDGKLGIHTYKRAEAIRIIENAISTGHAPAHEYALIPVAAEETR